MSALFLISLNTYAVSSDETKGTSSARISTEEFLSSPFAKSFKARGYKKALAASDGLLKKYPNDPLILRYRALTLEQLGRMDEAIALYRKILAQNPNHGPTRILLARAFKRKGKAEAAAREFRATLDVRETAYRHWAQAELNRMRVGKKASKKRYYFTGKGGMAYDSNPLLIPDDETLTRLGPPKRGIDYLMSWTAGYAPVMRRDTRVDLLYVGQETLHSGEKTSKVNFHSHGFAVVAKKRQIFGKRAVLFGGRYDFRSNFLKSHLFSVSNRFYLSADSSFFKRTRSHIYSRFNVVNFGPDGSDPPRTSRDGLRMGFGFTQYFYTAGLKRFLFVKEEFNINASRGDNFDRRGVLSRIGIHTPVDFVKKLDADASAGFDFGAYPDFTSLSRLDLEEREDARWDIYSALTYHWTPKIATRAFYRFIKSGNDNNFFDRNRHMAGGGVVFSI